MSMQISLQCTGSRLMNSFKGDDSTGGDAYLKERLPVESLFIPSTSFCSLSSWFTSSCAYHLITVTIFALITYHSIDLSLQT